MYPFCVTKCSSFQNEQQYAISGVSLIHGRDCGLHPGGVGAVGPLAEDPVHGRDAGELQQLTVRG